MDLKQNFKKSLLIISAVLLGAGIIFIALKGSTLTVSDEITNNDNWRDSLSVVPALDATSTLAVQRGLRVAENISLGEGLSATDLFSRQIFASYVSMMKGQTPGAVLTADQAEGIADELVQNLASATTTTYTIKDVKISTDNSGPAFTAYSKSLTKALDAFTTTKTPEIPIISEVFSVEGTGKVALLVPVIAQYKKLETDLLAIKVPTKLAPLHLRLVQAYAVLRSAITTMHGSFNDHVVILGAFSQYRNGLEELTTIAEEYGQALPIN